MCTSRFDFEEEQRAIMDEYLSHEDKQAATEEKDTQASEFDPISDNEEGDEGDSTQIQPTGQAQSEKSQGKRRRSIASVPEEGNKDEEDDEMVLPLPDTQQRISGRVRKRSKLLEGYEVELE
jgi:hypothetical protein